MVSAGVALVLAASLVSEGRLPAAPLDLYDVAWKRPLVAPEMFDWRRIEPGGPAIDPATGIVVVGTRDGWLHAMRPDGSLAWEFQGRGSFGAPVAIDSGSVFAGTNGGVLYALDLATGRVRWSYEAREELGTRPAVAGGLVLVLTLEDTLVAVDATTGAWKWHHRRDRREGFTIRGAADVLVRGKHAFAAYSDGTVAALDLATGTPRWERRLSPAGKYTDVDSLALCGGRLFAAAYSGAVLAVDPDDGKGLWDAKVPDATRLACIDGAVVAVSTAAVTALSQESGAPFWHTPLGAGGPAATPVVLGRWLAVPSGPGGLQLLDPATGRPLRVFDAGQGISGTVASAAGRAYVLANGGTLFALDLR